MACHLRSISLPSRPDSLVLKVEEELHKLKAHVASSSLTAQMMCNVLKRIGDLYECIEELFCLPRNQHGFSTPEQKKLVEEELEGSVKLLDIFRAMQDNLGEMKMNIQDIQLSLRRGGGAAVETKVQAYIRLAKKANKTVKKHTSNKSGSTVSIKEDNDLLVAVNLLIEAREITISLLQSILSFLSKQIVKPKTSKWPLASMTFHKRKVACEVEQENDGILLFALHSCDNTDATLLSKGQKQLQTLEFSIQGLEDGLQCLFRQLIRSRVSLLNMLSS